MSDKDNKRGRVFCTIVYPNENPYQDTWIEKLKALRCEAYISPLHEEVDDAGEQLGKPHHHVMICYPKITSYHLCKEDCDTFGGINPILCRSKKGTLRYFCHLDEDETSGKRKYPTESVISLNGGDYQREIGSTASRTEVVQEILNYIEENEVVSFYILCREAQNRPMWLKTLTSSGATYFIVSYLKSKNWTPEKRRSRQVSDKT